MKQAFIAIVFLTCSALTNADVLITPEYKFDISVVCEEGHVTCDKVTLEISDLVNNAKQEIIKGKSWHTVCADGKTPCRFIGYKFIAGSKAYYIEQSGEVEFFIDSKPEPVYRSVGQWQ